MNLTPLAFALALSAAALSGRPKEPVPSAAPAGSPSAPPVGIRAATQEGEVVGPPSAALLQLQETLAAADIRLDAARGVVSIPCEVLVREELLEYLLVRPNGASHESLLLTLADPTLINAALLALGLQEGRNATWTPVIPEPTREERIAGMPAYTVADPEGDGLHLSLGWRDGDETYLFRIEDLLSNLADGRSMRRHPWVFLGSRFVQIDDGDEVFAAGHYGNLINVSYFQEGYTLLTPALPECLEQTIWTANAWLLPERGSPVELFFSRTPLATLPEAWLESLPRIDEQAGVDGAGAEGGPPDAPSER